MQTRQRRNIGAQTAILRLRTEKRLPFPDCNHQARGAGVDDQVHSAVEIDQRPDVASDQLRAGEGQFPETDDVRGIQQAVDMLFQAKDRRTAIGGIAANAFKDADAVVQPGIDEGNSSL